MELLVLHCTSIPDPFPRKGPTSTALRGHWAKVCNSHQDVAEEHNVRKGAPRMGGRGRGSKYRNLISRFDPDGTCYN